MADFYGTNSGDFYVAYGTPDESDRFFGWAITNVPGDQGSVTDSDWMSGYSNDFVYGGAGADRISGNGINVTLDGGAGDDHISAYGGIGATIIGGEGVDFLEFNVSGGIIFSIAGAGTQQVFANGLSIVGIEQLKFFSSSGDNNVTGGELDDSFTGQYDTQVFHGGGGNDSFLTAGVSNGFLYGETGDDKFWTYAGNTTIDGGDGTDIVTTSAPISQATLYYETSTDTVLAIIPRGEGAVSIQKITNVELFEFGFEQKTKAEVIALATQIEFRTVSIASTSATPTDEGTASGSLATFTVTLNSASSIEQSVSYVVKHVDTEVNDFVGNALAGGEIFFLPGETSKEISVLINGDGAFEPDESFVVELVSPKLGLSIGTATAEAVIQNDDERPQYIAVSTDMASIIEGDSGVTEVTLLLTLDEPAKTSGTINYTLTQNGQVLFGADDFVGAVSGSVRIAIGDTSKTIKLSIQGDKTNEFNEVFELNIVSDSDRFAVSNPSTTLTILDEASDVYVQIGDDLDNDMIGSDGADHIEGLAGDDFIEGLAGDDHLIGGLGSDVFIGGEGADIIDGSPVDSEFFDRNLMVYHDELSMGGTQGVVVNLTKTTKAGQLGGTARDSFGDLDILQNINTIIGTSFKDTIYGFSLGKVDSDGFHVTGGQGNDLLVGDRGIDGLRYDIEGRIGGNNGIVANFSLNAVRVNGQTTQAGKVRDAFGDIDTVRNFEAVRGTNYDDYMYGGAEENYFIGLRGNDYFSGGAGSDTVSYRRDVEHDSTGGVVVNLSVSSQSAPTPSGEFVIIQKNTVIDSFGFIDRLKSIEVVYGTNNDDVFFGGNSKVKFYGEAGNDFIRGSSTSDLIDGGEGVDHLEGGKGNDVYVVGVGDVVTEHNNQGTDTIETDVEYLSMEEWANVENLTYTGDFGIHGIGNDAKNVIKGGNGSDGLVGMGGNDTLIGGMSSDFLNGGLGADTFVFGKMSDGDFGIDRIDDFEAGKGLGDVVKIHKSWGFTTASQVLAALTVHDTDKILIIDEDTAIHFSDHANTIFAKDDFLIG